jgi:hypothetical protein
MAITKVTTEVITGGAVTTPKIADNAISAAKIPDGTIATGHIADNAVTAAKIPDNVLTATMLPDNVILATHIPNATAPTFANTTVTGTLDVTGVISPTTHIDMPDDAYIKIGTGDDLQLYHDGSDSYISDAGTGILKIKGSEIRMQTTSGENMAIFNPDGSVQLQYDNSTKLATASGGVTVTGTLTATTLAGTLSTAAQTNITSLGTLTALTVDNIGINGETITLTGGSATGFLQTSTNVLQFGTSTNDPIKIYTNNAEVATILGNGNIGIGTASPERALHVVGGIHMPNASVISFDQASGTLRNAIYVDSGDDMIIGDTNFDDIYFSTGQKTKTVVIKQTTGNVGIGTTSPDGNLHVMSASAGSVSAHASADELVVEGSGNSGINILSANNGEGGLYFGDDGDNDIGRIRYDHTNNTLDFFVNAAEQVYITDGAIVPTADNDIDLGSASLEFKNLYIDGTAYLDNIDLKYMESQDDIYMSSADGNNNIYFRNGSDVILTVKGSNNNVGIGTTTPAHKLQVIGNIAVGSATTRSEIDANATYQSYYASESAARVTLGRDVGAGGAAGIAFGGSGGYAIIGTDNTSGSGMHFKCGGASVGSVTTNPQMSINGDLGYLAIGDSSQESGDLESTKRLYLEGGESVMTIKNTTNNGSSQRVNIGFLNSSGTRVGYISSTNTSTQLYTSSDYRQKENVTPLVDGLSRVQALKPVKYKWKDREDYSEGFLAHEIQEAGWHEGVNGEKDGDTMQAVDYGRITPLLVKAIQELEARIATLEG